MMSSPDVLRGIQPVSKNRWFWLRWLCVPILIVGHFIAFGWQEEDAAFYLPLLAVSALSCFVYLKALRGSLEAMVPLVTIFFIIYVGNYLQLFWIVAAQSDIRKFAPLLFDSMTPEVLHEAYRQATTGFAISSLVAFTLSRGKPVQTDKPPTISNHGRRAIASIGMIIAVLLAVTVASLSYAFDISVTGRTADVPFRFAGWVQNIGRTSVPALLLVVIVCADGLAGARKYFVGAITVVFLSAFVDVVLSTSKAPIILAALRLLVLFSVQGRLSRRRVIWLAVMAAVGALLFPFVNRLREQRVLGLDAETAIVVAQARGTDVEQFSVPVMLLYRVSGANMLLPILRAKARVDVETVLDGFTGGKGVTWYNTTEINGFAEGDSIGIAPSLLGYLYMIGGEMGQALGLVIILLFLWGSWKAIAVIRLRTRPALQALFGVATFFLLSEGTIESFVMPVVVIFTSIFLLEFVVYSVEKKVI